MEILDTGDDGKARRERPVRGATADLVADLDAGGGEASLAAEGPRLNHPADEPAPRSPGALILSSLTSADTLGLATILLELITLSGGYQVVQLLIMSEGPPDTTQAMLEQYTRGVTLCVAPIVVLALAGLFRLRAQSPAWVRAMVGASVIIAVLLVALTAAALWVTSGMPQDPQSPSLIGG
jgi:hypothetical protein